MRRGKRTRRSRDVRERLEAEARRLVEEASKLHGELFTFERDHLDRAERDALDRARALVGQAGDALDSLASSLGKPAGRRP